jgi:hypothetical protein
MKAKKEDNATSLYFLRRGFGNEKQWTCCNGLFTRGIGKNVLRNLIYVINIWPAIKRWQLYQMSGYFALKHAHTICSKCTLFVRRIHHKNMTYNQMLKIRQTCAFQKGMICTKCTLLAHSIFKVFVMGGKIFPFSFWSRKDSHECNAACEQNYAFLCHRSKV